MPAALAALLLLAPAAEADAPAWPRFRGPAGTATAADASPPLVWDGATGENVRWTTAPARPRGQ